MKWLLFFGFLFMLVSCSFVDGFKNRDFTYYEARQKRKLNVKVPNGFADAKVVFDTAEGKEQYYYYDDGALIYFSRSASWPTENESFIVSRRNTGKASRSFIFKGIDKDGLHWKEIQIDKFRFGYSYVPAARLEKFDEAVNSIRFRM